MSFALSYRFSDRWSSTASVSEQESVIQGQELTSENARKTRTLSVGLRYSLTRQIGLNGNYGYREASGAVGGLAGSAGDATGHTLTLGISYNGDRLEW